MFLATMESEHYAWQTLGETEQEAREALARGFASHMKQIGVGCPFLDLADRTRHAALGSARPEDVLAEPELLAELGVVLDEWYSVRVVELAPGQCARDGSVLEAGEVSG